MRFSLAITALVAAVSAQSLGDLQSLEGVALSFESAVLAASNNPAALSSLGVEATSIINSIGGELSQEGINYSTLFPPGLLPSATAASTGSGNGGSSSPSGSMPANTGSTSGSAAANTATSKNVAPAPTGMGFGAAAVAGVVGAVALL